ncbi:MAG: hypothetical protein PHU50_07740, partial [Kiritimatiellae bacterium]|nr:hypothetical protein [Kiritimatiellia bacterium]
MENFRAIFPRHGKKFSTLWKIRGILFHTMEKPAYLFPRCGKLFSTLWKLAVLVSLGAMAAAASPFTVSAERREHAGAPAL